MARSASELSKLVDQQRVLLEEARLEIARLKRTLVQITPIAMRPIGAAVSAGLSGILSAQQYLADIGAGPQGVTVATNSLVGRQGGNLGTISFASNEMLGMSAGVLRTIAIAPGGLVSSQGVSITPVGAGTTNQVLVSQGTSIPIWQAIQNANIANATITGAKLVNQTITNVQLAGSSVITGKIADLAVTNPKLGADAVTTDKILANTILPADLADEDNFESAVNYCWPDLPSQLALWPGASVISAKAGTYGSVGAAASDVLLGRIAIRVPEQADGLESFTLRVLFAIDSSPSADQGIVLQTTSQQYVVDTSESGEATQSETIPVLESISASHVYEHSYTVTAPTTLVAGEMLDFALTRLGSDEFDTYDDDVFFISAYILNA